MEAVVVQFEFPHLPLQELFSSSVEDELQQDFAVFLFEFCSLQHLLSVFTSFEPQA
jgi:hypothetical protein